MRKLLILASFATLLLAGCAKTELASVDNGSDTRSDAIDFTTYTGRAVTKADATDLTESFNVEAFIHSTKKNFFKGTNYTYSASGFTGDTTRYWPTSGNLDFYAVSPLKYTNTASTPEEKTLSVIDSTFSLTKFNGKTDILGARKMNVAKSNPVAPVALVFNHKLTKVAFKAVGADSTKIYKIDSIVVTANSSSKYNFGASESWDSSSDAFPYVFLGTDKTAHAAITVIPFKTQKPISVGSTYYLIPKQGTVKAKVRYSIYDHATMIDTTATPIEVTLPVTSWGINKSIVYNLTLNFTSSAEPISFTATVEDWDANTNVNVPVFEGALNGLFTIDAQGTQVRFSKGNMYYDGSSFKFENNQYDYRCYNGVYLENAVINGIKTNTPSGTVGSFYWDENPSVAIAYTYSNSSYTSGDIFFTNDKSDKKKPNPNFTVNGALGVWRCLTGGPDSEWKYLVDSRSGDKAPDIGSQTDARFAEVKVNDVKGLLLFPDVFTWPATVTTTPTTFNTYSSNWNNVNYSKSDFAELESAGCVFLPAAGSRPYTSTASGCGTNGAYISASNYPSTHAYSFYFYGDSSGVRVDALAAHSTALPARLVFVQK